MTLPSVNDDITELDPPVLPVPEDTLYLGDRMDQMLAELNDIRKSLQAGTRPRPSIIEVFFYDGIAAATPFGRYTTSVRWRLEGFIVLLSGTTSIVSLLVGTRRYRFRVNTGDNAAFLPFPLTIEPGVDIAGECATIQAAGQIGGFYLIGYADGTDD